jgi:hypothetical protein
MYIQIFRVFLCVYPIFFLEGSERREAKRKKRIPAKWVKRSEETNEVKMGHKNCILELMVVGGGLYTSG